MASSWRALGRIGWPSSTGCTSGPGFELVLGRTMLLSTTNVCRAPMAIASGNFFRGDEVGRAPDPVGRHEGRHEHPSGLGSCWCRTASATVLSGPVVTRSSCWSSSRSTPGHSLSSCGSSGRLFAAGPLPQRPSAEHHATTTDFRGSMTKEAE